MPNALRLNPDNGAELQTLDCTGNWVLFFPKEGSVSLFADLLSSIASMFNPTATPTDPPASGSGDCADYDINLDSNQTRILPVSIDTGDTIEITNLQGAFSDGSISGILPIDISRWICGNGQPFHFGRCESGEYPSISSDPLNSIAHGSLIMNINGVWYDARPGSVFTVPSGVTSASCVFQVNDDPLDDNSGSLTFHVHVCKQSGTTYHSHFIDFTAGTGGFAAYTGAGTYGTHTSDGWLSVFNIGGFARNELRIHSLSLPVGVHYVQARIVYSLPSSTLSDHNIINSDFVGAFDENLSPSDHGLVVTSFATLDVTTSELRIDLTEVTNGIETTITLKNLTLFYDTTPDPF